MNRKTIHELNLTEIDELMRLVSIEDNKLQNHMTAEYDDKYDRMWHKLNIMRCAIAKRIQNEQAFSKNIR